MARINNLTNFLNDVAIAIKTKLNDETSIPAAQFDTKIMEIETGGTYQDKSLSITTNGQYNLLPDTNFDAMSSVSIDVNVPSENLDSVITAQEQKLEALETLLEGKVGGGKVKPNIFVQETEPTKKSGIWLKMSNKTAEHYVSDNNVYTGGNWAPASETANVPTAVTYGDAVNKDTDIFLFGGNGGRTKAYKYDTLTNTYTQLANIPYDFYSGCTVRIDDTIYLLGGNADAKRNYKYDITNDTYTSNTALPIYIYGKYTTVVGTDIYLFANTDAYKYDTMNDTYTKLANIPFNVNGTSVISVGTNIYLFGSYNNASKAYKYDTLTNTYTQLTNTPYNYQYGDVAVVGSKIHLFGGTDYTNNHYEYNIITGTYTQSVDIPYTFRNGISVTCGNDIHLFGSDIGNNGAAHRKYIAAGKTYSTDNTVVIAEGITYSTELFNTNFEEGYKPKYNFSDAWFYTLQDGLDGTMPVYYGNGTNWINIKNPPTEGGNE